MKRFVYPLINVTFARQKTRDLLDSSKKQVLITPFQPKVKSKKKSYEYSQHCHYCSRRSR
jgi:hypothetical protein